MRVTTKGQVTIPQHIRAKLGIGPHSEVDFREVDDKVYLEKAKAGIKTASRLRRYRGVATVKMTTDEIMELTRGAE
jgi:AbrB family looped-hinge helix DNA binding protein